MRLVVPPAPDEDGQTYFEPLEDMWDHIDVAMVRERVKWEDSFDPSNNICIQLGAGRKTIDGWMNLDYPEWDAHADFDGKRWRIPYDDGTVAEIASYHTLDHLKPWAVVRTLREVERVLIPGGVFTNIVPHYSSQLANECIMHHTRFAIDSFRNIFSERQYSHTADGTVSSGRWRLRVGANFIFGLTERNLVLVTQLVKED